MKNTINHQRLLTDLKALSSANMQGRKTSTKGNQLAQAYLINRYKELELKAWHAEFKMPFKLSSYRANAGTNIVGFRPGTKYPEKYVVVTAHYDHLGAIGKKIFYGADDNASGVAAMLALAEYTQAHPPNHSIIFVATDAEEIGLWGAQAFVAKPPVALDKIKLNINLDMLGIGGSKNRLYIAGTRLNPSLNPLADKLISRSSVCLKRGHESRERSRDASIPAINWRKASDHAAFIAKDIPYLYFGVDLHRHYHETTDNFDNINQPFFSAAAETIIDAFVLFDNGF